MKQVQTLSLFNVITYKEELSILIFFFPLTLSVKLNL